MQEKLFYLNSKGEKLCAVISKPAEDFKAPIIILCHGFDSSKEARSVLALEKELNVKNLNTFRIDLYAHGESDGKFENITVSEAVDDILRAISFLKSQGFAKVGLVGSSFGGLAAILAAAKSHDLFVLALRSPASDLNELLLNDWGEAGLLKWKHEGVSQNHNKDLKYNFVLDAQKNIGYEVAGKIFVPTLIVHGDADQRVPINQSQQLASLIPGCHLEIIKDADHSYTKPEFFDIMINKIVNFIIRPLAKPCF